jgi:antitoxin HicB
MTKTSRKKSPRSLAELSTLDDFLKAEGKLEEFQAIAIKEVLDWQIAKGIRPQVAILRDAAQARGSSG